MGYDLHAARAGTNLGQPDIPLKYGPTDQNHPRGSLSGTRAHACSSLARAWRRGSVQPVRWFIGGRFSNAREELNQSTQPKLWFPPLFLRILISEAGLAILLQVITLLGTKQNLEVGSE